MKVQFLNSSQARLVAVSVPTLVSTFISVCDESNLLGSEAGATVVHS
jgi:hypothetical protein